MSLIMDYVTLKIFIHLLFTTLQCWELKLGLHTCYVKVLLINYIPSLNLTFSKKIKIVWGGEGRKVSKRDVWVWRSEEILCSWFFLPLEPGNI